MLKDRCRRGMKALVVISLLLLAGRGNPTNISCLVVKPYVWLYGEEAAIAWAKANGYTDKQIAAMRKRCF